MVDYEKLVARTNPFFERCIRCRAGAHRPRARQTRYHIIGHFNWIGADTSRVCALTFTTLLAPAPSTPGTASTAQTLEETYVGLSFDHAPTHPDEHARLRAVGSIIDPTCWLNGGLATSRAISRRLPFDNASITTTTLVVSFAMTVLSTFPVGIATILTFTLVTAIPDVVVWSFSFNPFVVSLALPFQGLSPIIHCFFIFRLLFPLLLLFPGLVVCFLLSLFSISSSTHFLHSLTLPFHRFHSFSFLICQHMVRHFCLLF